tara:strand:- start:77 stop:301 length:225 start_codon:yes stop_codon:yes gene_type:complete
MKTKETVTSKEVTESKVSENGSIEKPTAKEELESIKLQYQDSLEKQQQYANIAQRCLGAIEILERLTEDGDVSE